MLEAPVGEHNTGVSMAPESNPSATAAATAALTAAAEAAVTLNAEADGAPVRCIMTAKVISFTQETSLEEATRVMLARGISGAPVVDGGGRPVGMVSKTDLLEAWHEHGPQAPAGSQPEVPALVSHRRAAGPEAVRVGDIMVPYLLAVSGQSPISLAAALMAYEGVHRLLVLDDSNKMEGIITALDVLRWMAQLSGFSLPHYTQRQRP